VRSPKRHTGAIASTQHAASVDLKYVCGIESWIRWAPLGDFMRKLGKMLLTGTTLSAFVSVAAIDIATADPVRLAAAVCPQGQVGTPPNCKPAPPPVRTQQPPPHLQPPPPPHPVPQPQVHTNPTPPAHTNQPTQQLHTNQPTQQLHTNQPTQQLHTNQPTQQLHTNQPTQQLHTNQPTQQLHTNQAGPTTEHKAPPHAPPLPALTATQAVPLQKHTGPAALLPTSTQGQPIRSLTGLRTERHESVVGGRTVITEGSRVIVRENNGQIVIRHDDVDRFRYGARDVRVERRGDDNVTTVVLANGDRVVTVIGPDGRIMRRSRFDRDNREIVLIAAASVAAGVGFFVERPEPVIRIPRERYIVDMESAPPDYVYGAFAAPPVEQVDQAYSLDQVLDSPSLRDLMPSVDLDTITFETGSWEVGPDQVDRLSGVADGLNRVLQANPREVFLVEGHTDAVGVDVDNMSLSDRRAETVALILSDKFGVPPENLVTQGYGSQFLRIPTPGPERRNRRVTIRRITPLLAGK
jgi:outer membrane protein OmpA-like peptidoglycan-associated protein